MITLRFPCGEKKKEKKCYSIKKSQNMTMIVYKIFFAVYVFIKSFNC